MNDQGLDASLSALGVLSPVCEPDAFMDGVWQRAGQLGEIAERRRRTAMFCGLFVVGLTAGAGTIGLPYGYGAGERAPGYDFAASDQLSPAALLHVGG